MDDLMHAGIQFNGWIDLRMDGGRTQYSRLDGWMVLAEVCALPSAVLVLI